MTGQPVFRNPKSRDRGWMDRAACHGKPLAAFFPEKGDKYNEAKKICARCPVTADCYAYAEANGDRDGVWGGTTPDERDRKRRTRRRALQRAARAAETPADVEDPAPVKAAS